VGDARLAALLRSLFGTEVTRYLAASEQAEEAAHREVVAAIDAALLASVGGHSEFARCFVLPAVLGLRASVERHYTGIVASRQPQIAVAVSKSAVVDERGWHVELRVSNSGTGAAADCTIALHPLGVDHKTARSR
jgi:hypothetical protein